MNAADLSGIGAGSIVRRNADGSYRCITDEVAMEEPLEIRIGNKPVAVTMRTPGNDEELAAGFLLAEGIVRHRVDVGEIRHCAIAGSFENVINVKLGGKVKINPQATQRFGSISTSCGLCGKTSIGLIRGQFPALDHNKMAYLAIEQLLRLPELLRSAQGNFARTGGIHAAGIFDSGGNLVVVREDVGRHNAVDKAIGHQFLENRLPLHGQTLLVSGRTSLEIVQKALAAGIAIVASISAPSSLAINFAREAGQTLIGFLRPPTFNVYSHIERLTIGQ